MLTGYVSVREAGEKIGVSARHVRRLLGNGLLEGKQDGGNKLVLVESIERYLANNSS